MADAPSLFGIPLALTIIGSKENHVIHVSARCSLLGQLKAHGMSRASG